MFDKLKADRPCLCDYSTHRQTPWTHNDSFLLFSALSKAERWLTDGQTDTRYHVHYLPSSQSIITNHNLSWWILYFVWWIAKLCKQYHVVESGEILKWRSDVSVFLLFYTCVESSWERAWHTPSIVHTCGLWSMNNIARFISQPIKICANESVCNSLNGVPVFMGRASAL